MGEIWVSRECDWRRLQLRRECDTATLLSRTGAISCSSQNKTHPTCDGTAAHSGRRRAAPRASPVAHSHSYTYTVVMKNITLSVDENILATVRRHAAERNSTINALVREYLTGLAAHQDRAKRARARLRQLSARSQGRLGKKTWTREDLH